MQDAAASMLQTIHQGYKTGDGSQRGNIFPAFQQHRETYGGSKEWKCL